MVTTCARRTDEYGSERELVDDFLRRLPNSSPWRVVNWGSEFFYQRGRTDVIAVDEEGHVIAFEAKISKWRQALQQAYRNTCFAHRSYVLLPKETAIRAAQYSAEFNRLGIGICFMEGEILILHEANQVEPLQPWLSIMATRHIGGESLLNGHYQPD